MSIPSKVLALVVLLVGCGSSSSQLDSQNQPVIPQFSARQTIHEGELASNPALRADLSRQQLISYLESSNSGAFDTGGVGQDLLPFYCSQPMRLQLAGEAPHVAGVRILDSRGTVLASWQGGSQQVDLPVGDYRLELTSSGQADTHVFLKTRAPEAIRALTTDGSTPGVYLAQLSETPQAVLVVPETALIGVSSDGSSEMGTFGSEADFLQVLPNAGAGLKLAVHQYFGNGGTNVAVVTCASTSAADLSTGLGKLQANPMSYQLALADVYGLSLEQADALAQTALAWASQQQSLLFLDIPDAVDSSAAAVSWRQQRTQLVSNQCLLYWPGLNLGPGQQIGSSSSVLGLLDGLGAQSGPGTVPSGQKLQAAQSPEVDYTLGEVADLSAVQINPVYPDLTITPGVLLQSQPGIPDLSCRQKLMTIEQSIKLYMQWYVFSANNATTWQFIIQGVSATMQTLYQQGVLAGDNSAQAFQFDCGVPVTMSGLDILNGYLILTGRVLLAPNLPSVTLSFSQVMQGL